MGQGLIDQLIGLVQASYGPTRTVKELRQHFLDVMETNTYFIEVEGSLVVGYLEWKPVPGTKYSLHVTEVLCTKPGILQKLKRRFYQLDWKHLMFRVHKTDTWRYYTRRSMSHV